MLMLWDSIFHILQVSQDLVNRALSADSSFTKQMNMIPKVSANFELMLDTTSCERSIESLNFFQVKGESLRNDNS